MMNLHISFQHLEATKAIKDRVKKRLEKCEKYLGRQEVEIFVHLALEKDLHVAEVTCHADHHEFVAVTKTHDLYEAIDLSVHKLETQLKKIREKRKERRKGKTDKEVKPARRAMTNED